MKKINILIIFAFLFLVCTGCKAKYTLTYNDEFYDEEVEISDIEDEEKKYFERIYSRSEDIKFDDSNFYNYYENNGTIKLSYNIGPVLTKTKLLSYCYENVYILDKEDYINIYTDGENYCKDKNIEINFTTDRVVYKTNAKRVVNNVFIWDTKNEGINILFGKEKKNKKNSVVPENDYNQNESKSSGIILIIVLILAFGGISFLVVKLLKNNRQTSNTDD